MQHGQRTSERVAELERSMPVRTWTWTTHRPGAPNSCPDFAGHIAGQLESAATFARRNDAFVRAHDDRADTPRRVAALLDYWLENPRSSKRLTRTPVVAQSDARAPTRDAPRPSRPSSAPGRGNPRSDGVIANPSR